MLTGTGGIEVVELVAEWIRYELALLELRGGYDIACSIFEALGIEVVVTSSALSDQTIYHLKPLQLSEAACRSTSRFYLDKKYGEVLTTF